MYAIGTSLSFDKSFVWISAQYFKNNITNRVPHVNCHIRMVTHGVSNLHWSRTNSLFESKAAKTNSVLKLQAKTNPVLKSQAKTNPVLKSQATGTLHQQLQGENWSGPCAPSAGWELFSFLFSVIIFFVLVIKIQLHTCFLYTEGAFKSYRLLVINNNLHLHQNLDQVLCITLPIPIIVANFNR